MQKYQALILNIFTTSDYNGFAGEIIIANRKENSLVDNYDIPGLRDNSDLDIEIATRS